MYFKDFIKNKALEDKLPFEMNVEPEPWDGPHELVARFQLPRYNELLSREAWFYDDVLASTSGQRRTELQIEYFSLAKLLKDKWELESDAEAIKALSQLTSGEEGVETDKRQAFIMQHMDRFNKLTDMAQLVEDNRVVSWMKITFFLMSRHDGNWSFSKSAALRPSEIAALLQFITQEANGGVLPEALSEGEDLGKLSPGSSNPSFADSSNGANSTGSSTQAASTTSGSAPPALAASPSG